MHVREVEELVAGDDLDAWAGVLAAVDAAPPPVRVLAAAREQGLDVLFRLQVTTRSTLGALALHCGGLVIDHGWLRILGAGAPGLPDLATVNGLGDPHQVTAAPAALLVGYDVMGGRFAIDGGGLGVAPGQVCYWGPDTLDWVGLGTGHSGFVSWALSADLDTFYTGPRSRSGNSSTSTTTWPPN